MMAFQRKYGWWKKKDGFELKYGRFGQQKKTKKNKKKETFSSLSESLYAIHKELLGSMEVVKEKRWVFKRSMEDEKEIIAFETKCGSSKKKKKNFLAP